MPLAGADDAGLFCVMLPQDLDQSIKALESFRPYKHEANTDNDKSFANDYMLLAIRDRKKNSGLLHTVHATLEPEELAAIANRLGRPPSFEPFGQTGPKPTVGRTQQQGRLQSVTKGKRLQSISDGLEPRNLAKRSKVKSLTGPRMSESLTQLSDDDIASPLVVPHARSSTTRTRVQQQTPLSPSDNPQPTPVQAPRPQQANLSDSRFTDEQAQRIQFTWRVDFEGMEHEIMRTLSAAGTFRDLLDALREEAELVPSASQQINTDFWSVKYVLADGTGKAVFIKTTNPQFELNFDGLLRSLAEKVDWKNSPDVIIQVELRAMVPRV